MSTPSLDETAKRMLLAMQSTNDGLWDWNLVSNEHFFSPRWKEMLGFCDDEIPNTYDEWLDLHAKWQAEYLLDGEPVVQVEVKPHEFSRYLDATGCANDLNNLLIFAVKIANGNHY